MSTDLTKIRNIGINSRTKKRHKVGRLGRMHADEMEEIDEAFAGDIVAMFGIDCASGDTFTDETVQIAIQSRHPPRVSRSIVILPSSTGSGPTPMLERARR